VLVCAVQILELEIKQSNKNTEIAMQNAFLSGMLFCERDFRGVGELIHTDKAQTDLTH
jgi:hypothetical protein